MAGLAAAPTEEPTPLDRALQPRYLDRAVYLLADVKVRSLQSRKVVSSTWPRGADLSSEKPSTLVTAAGVFYSEDYDDTRQVNTNVRPGVPIDPSNPADQNQLLVQGGTVGSVIELHRTSPVILAAGTIARIVGVEEISRDIHVTLEGIDGTKVVVLVRGAGEAPDPTDGRAAQFDEMLRKLCFFVPEHPEARMAAIDPAWSEAVRGAIREGRVEPGMTPFQVLLSWGFPLHISQTPDVQEEIWLYKRGATVLEQLRNTANVYLIRGVVDEVETGGTPAVP